ncbi:general substrate transporter [Ilyonectria destructans]|nr:general substrate transporter [Ilyonectria destructans]
MAEKGATDAQVEHLEPDHEDATMALTPLAARFEAREQSLTRSEAIKENIKPILWCMYMFFICVTWGFDGLAGAIVLAIAAFREDFGRPYAGDYVVDANWQLGWMGATIFGLVFGAFVTGLTVNKWGRQPSIAVAYILSVGGIFLQVFAETPVQFFGSKILTGLPMGCFTTVAPTYASEMAPTSIRGAITAGMNFAIVLGQLIAYGVMREASKYNGAMSYKVLFATQWGFALVGLAILPWFPESPYWLIAHGRDEKARQNIAKLHKSDYDVDGKMAEIQQSLARLNQDNSSQGSMAECLSRKQIKRTVVATSMFFIQTASGNAWVVGYMSYFMQLAGMDTAKSFDTTVGLCGLMVVGNMCGWFFVEWFGRRNTALWGTAGLSVTLLLIGILAVVNAPGAIWGQIVFMAVWSFVYQATIGSVAWPITSENATSRLRAPTQALATMVNGLSASIWSFSLPYAINPDQGNLGGKIAFIFGAILVIATVFVYVMIPETGKRTYTEIDELWSRDISPRMFHKTKLVTLADAGVKEVEEKTEN